MTAEIALLNRRALAFAADSAVTIGDGTTEKIYNSAEKIFELSRKSPIGLMLYNSLEFVGVPLDILARKFRSERDIKFNDSKHIADCFLNFLCEIPRYEDNENDHLIWVLSDEMQEISREHGRGLAAFFVERVEAGKADYNEARTAFAQKLFDDHRKTHEIEPLEGFLENVTLDQFKTRYWDVIQKVVKLRLPRIPISNELLESIIVWALAVVKSSIFSNDFTGLVFGGFGEKELFPSLYSVELDGVFFGKLKIKVTNQVDIDRRGKKAEIIPFAQSEMVERFLFGIDEQIQSNLLKYVARSLAKAAGGATLNLAPESYAEEVGKYLERVKRRSRDETLDMVDFMPKQELAYTAEAFVSLTSVKRKVSSQKETVGGPIDVAVITKNEGFIWIKRKHYFDTELNPGYSVRVFGGRADSGEGNDGPEGSSRSSRGEKKTASRTRPTSSKKMGSAN
jgi:hypothetical protein